MFPVNMGIPWASSSCVLLGGWSLYNNKLLNKQWISCYSLFFQFIHSTAWLNDIWNFMSEKKSHLSTIPCHSVSGLNFHNKFGYELLNIQWHLSTKKFTCKQKDNLAVCLWSIPSLLFLCQSVHQFILVQAITLETYGIHETSQRV